MNNSNYIIYKSLPITTAVSAILFEKPHSLSYHDNILAIPDDKTFDCCAANIDDSGE